MDSPGAHDPPRSAGSTKRKKKKIDSIRRSLSEETVDSDGEDDDETESLTEQSEPLFQLDSTVRGSSIEVEEHFTCSFILEEGQIEEGYGPSDRYRF